MADWKQVQTAITEAVASLGRGGTLVVKKDAPETRMQFSVSPEGDTLRTEVSNESAGDDERLRERGWELCDEWSGVWRRSTPWPAAPEKVEEAVSEAAFVVRAVWGNPRPGNFGYLAWQEPEAAPGWQFWKAGKEKQLKFPNLGLPAAPEPDPNS
ncbi:hypothetical protein LKO27_10720 [Tessaracoccus sp. OS52]|uniref:TY-Chap domain-containing protein n=1 Tax=Tessaracoccus sp. OS52 TaxID=2886691 RepID=UPI001D1002E1|nr:hypothetical protein [Tessaracoccus sp. OS52]MCC2593877.1 hypothetical protein [Tessaracoccus sp. OS52]